MLLIDIRKLISVALAIALITTITLFALGRLRGIYFWSTAAVAGIFAYWILPRMKK